MDTQVEHQLRLALAARAAELPSDASSRLLAADYRPRPGLRRPALAAGGAAVVAGALVGSLAGRPRHGHAARVRGMVCDAHRP